MPGRIMTVIETGSDWKRTDCQIGAERWARMMKKYDLCERGIYGHNREVVRDVVPTSRYYVHTEDCASSRTTVLNYSTCVQVFNSSEGNCEVGLILVVMLTLPSMLLQLF